MKYSNAIKVRLSYRYTVLSLLFFILALGIFSILRPFSAILAFLLAAFFFMVLVFFAAYISAAQELWVFKELAKGSRNSEDGWTDLTEGKVVPDEVEEVRDVMNNLKTRMDEAIMSQRRFLADASHEMRSPITIMKGNIEIALRRDRDRDEYRRILNSNLEEIDRLEYLLKDLMFLARTDANELIMNMGEVRLDELLKIVYEGLLPLSIRKGIAMSIDIKEGSEPVIIGDADRLRQLFTNLVENALKYTPAGGSVKVELCKVAGISKIVVSDTGMGIPKAELPRIFERFYRVDKARSRELGGTGLGLCICKWIVDAHQGDISIESEEGVGTSVTVMFL
jgi:signal transduction histidine kinase